MLPAASRRTTPHSIVRFNPCTTLPAVFIAAACNRSVPTAAAGCMPNSRMSIGVINEPPPMPVMPTSMPMANAEMA